MANELDMFDGSPGEGSGQWPDGGGPLRQDPAGRAPGEPSLILDLDGFEGPLDLLLNLARQQKVDIAKISVLALAASAAAFAPAQQGRNSVAVQETKADLEASWQKPLRDTWAASALPA